MKLKAPPGTTDTHLHFYDGASSAAPALVDNPAELYGFK